MSHYRRFVRSLGAKNCSKAFDAEQSNSDIVRHSGSSAMTNANTTFGNTWYPREKAVEGKIVRREEMARQINNRCDRTAPAQRYM